MRLRAELVSFVGVEGELIRLVLVGALEGLLGLFGVLKEVADVLAGLVGLFDVLRGVMAGDGLLIVVAGLVGLFVGVINVGGVVVDLVGVLGLREGLGEGLVVP